jgi:hypothetical protein
MKLLQRRVMPFTDTRLKVIADTVADLKVQMHELSRLRERLSKAQLSARRSRLLANDRGSDISTVQAKAE